MKLILFIVTHSCVILMGLAACGVKGKPLAPLNPQVMGHGLPEYRGTNAEIPAAGGNSDEDDQKSNGKNK